MNVYLVSVRRDNGADYRPQTVKRTVTLGEAENLVTIAIVASTGAADAGFIAADMRGQMLTKTCTAWGYESNTKTIAIRVEKVTP
jgi:hypothetical protein